jgi:hypothetical protein
MSQPSLNNVERVVTSDEMGDRHWYERYVSGSFVQWITRGYQGMLLVAFIYLSISIYFLYNLLIGNGDVAQQDWGIPLTNSAAQSNFNSILFAWDPNGFGGLPVGRYSFPYFPVLNAFLAPLGFVGGTEIKILAVSLVALGGVTTYALARSFGLRFFSSFLSGLFFMTTAVVFDWLMFGWIFYILVYDLLPLFVLAIKKYLEYTKLRFALVCGLIFSIAMMQPATLLIYPAVGLIFVLFEAKRSIRMVLRGLSVLIIAALVWVATALSFFMSYLFSDALSFYQGDFFHIMHTQFKHFSDIANPIRLWGSTYNFQFETYFPQELVAFSFIPIILAITVFLLKPRDKRVRFCSVIYLFVFLSYLVYENLEFVVYNIPFGAIFEATSIFLIPGALGLALLMGYANEEIPRSIHQAYSKFEASGSSLSMAVREKYHNIINIIYNITRKDINIFKIAKNAMTTKVLSIIFSMVLLILLVLAGTPWWTGQASGVPMSGLPTKLNLYQVPSSYTEWDEDVAAGDGYFVLYVPLGTSSNVKISDSSYFSKDFEGVNNGIFIEVNDLPYMNGDETVTLLNDLTSGSFGLAQKWGSYSIKYVVVYTNTISKYDISDVLARLSAMDGFVEVLHLNEVVVFENEYAKPIIYSDSSGATTHILYHDPTSYTVAVNSSSPFLLTLNQAYSSDWVVSVNGAVLPSSAHFRLENGCNGWQIDATGELTVSVHYAPQTNYSIGLVISTGALIIITLYIVLATVADVRRNAKKSEK